MTSAYRGRFAPSPTGALHLGHARTYLVAWLRARAAGGRVVLRVEDLDAPRVVPGALESILDDLRWLGLDWDEGGDLGGPDAPYAQSGRAARYAAALARLTDAGLVYPCTCTRRELADAASAPHGADELGPRYPGTCRAGVSHPGRPATLRFAAPDDHEPFDDVLGGHVAPGEVGGDFVLRRADGVFAYQLAVVVDDAAMGVTEVVRGDDLLASTPRQLALYRALGLTPPAFLHVPLVLGADGVRLAKRHAALGVGALRRAGHTAGEVLAALARSVGIEPPVARPAARDLVGSLELARIPRGPCRVAPGPPLELVADVVT